jgi:hypothetical protein
VEEARKAINAAQKQAGWIDFIRERSRYKTGTR